MPNILEIAGKGKQNVVHSFVDRTFEWLHVVKQKSAGQTWPPLHLKVNVVQSEKLLSCATRRLNWDIPQYPSIRGDYYVYFWFEFNTCVFHCVTSNDTKPYTIILLYIYFALNHVWFQCQSFTNFILIWKKNKQNPFLARSILYFTFLKIGFVSQNVINTFFIFFSFMFGPSFWKALITQNAHNSSVRVCVISVYAWHEMIVEREATANTFWHNILAKTTQNQTCWQHNGGDERIPSSQKRQWVFTSPMTHQRPFLLLANTIRCVCVRESCCMDGWTRPA